MIHALFLILFISLYGCDTSSLGESLSQQNLEDGILPSEKRIFLSSTLHGGDMNGISGANDICQNLAQQAGLKKSYKALLAVDGSSLSDQFSGESKVYIFTPSGKQLVSNSFTDLIDNKAISNINFDEYSVEITNFTYAWTGILNNSVSNNCTNWTMNGPSEGAWALSKGSPECVDPNDLNNPMPSMMYHDSSSCEANSFEWRNNEGKDVIGIADRMTCNDQLHIYCISE